MAEQAINLDTLDFIYKHTKDVAERQGEDAKALDAKSVHIFTAAAVVIGLAGVSLRSGDSPNSVVIALSIALGAFVLTAFFTGWQLWPKSFRTSRQADVLWSEYWSDDADTVRQALVDDMSSGYTQNKGKPRSQIEPDACRSRLVRRRGVRRWRRAA